MLAFGGLLALGRHTITGHITAVGRQFQDWSADYRLFSKQRIDLNIIFGSIRQKTTDRLVDDAPLIAAMDDTLLRRGGNKTEGVGWRRDPLGPPFHTNFVKGQRFIQLSAALSDRAGSESARMVPIDFTHAPSAKKPSRKAEEAEWENYRLRKKELNLSRQGADRIRHLRDWLDESGQSSRSLWVAVDGSYTNGNVLKSLPKGVVLIGRIRKDAKLLYTPEQSSQAPVGRRRAYGDAAPTPEQLRKDDSVPWQTIEINASGEMHKVRIKTMEPLMWRTAGADHHLRLIVIAPLGYRPRKGSRILYRKPAYLVATDPSLPVERIVQAYFYRWDIEVNFRDEKTLLGVGQAMVRTKNSVEAAPALSVAAYAMLLIAGEEMCESATELNKLPSAKWRKQNQSRRVTTNELVKQLRQEMWGKALGVHSFSHFVKQKQYVTNTEKLLRDPASAILYATN